VNHAGVAKALPASLRLAASGFDLHEMVGAASIAPYSGSLNAVNNTIQLNFVQRIIDVTS
jgi:hypothetical protein